MNNNLDNPLFESNIPEIKNEEINIEIKDNKKRFILFIIIVLILSSIFCGLLVYALNNRGTTINKNNEFTADDLYVIHSKKDFGDEIKDISNFNSLETAYYYTFYIENVNSVTVPYKVIIEDVSTNKIKNKDKINYAIYKNDDLVFSGMLDNNTKTIMTSANIGASEKDNYKIKLWTTTTSGYYKFRINITN